MANASGGPTEAWHFQVPAGSAKAHDCAGLNKFSDSLNFGEACAVRGGMREFHASIQLLSELPAIGYVPKGPAAAEPTALAVLALLAGNHLGPAERHCQWLATCQSNDGSVGVFADQGAPAWCTGLAILAWSEWAHVTHDTAFQQRITAACDWLLGSKGTTTPRSDELGHDSTLVGWSWAEHTHSWIEPTAFQVLALKRLGLTEHPRVREGIRLLLDRQLPSGGCNYGNTFVLGQQLLPHVQPTAIALLALWNEGSDTRRTRSLHYLRQQWPSIIGHSSRCFAAMALKTYQPPDKSPDEFSPHSDVVYSSDDSGYHLALAALAQLPRSPLVEPHGMKGPATGRTGEAPRNLAGP